MGKLFIIRHGETDYNKENKYLGRIDISLNSLGRQQARDLIKKLNKLKFDIIITSPLKRALETANIINRNAKEIIIEQGFIERSVGVYEGLTKKEAKKKFPDLYDRNITRIFNEAPPKGETIKDVQERIFKTLDELKTKFHNKNILIVTHGFISKVINKYFHRQISDKEFFNFVLNNGEVKEYKI